jgi:mannosyl-3-phosphoglycerate phosphatase
MTGKRDRKKGIIVFTDLDGTLLDHEDYSFDGAAPALERLRREGIPLVITTSKTRREIELFREVLGFRDPFISENGGGVFFPGGYGPWIPGGEPFPPHVLVRFGKPYGEIRRFVTALPPSLGVRGFGDLATEEIARLTGLPPDQARLAAERDFTEPFLLGKADALPELRVLADRKGLQIIRGGRFHHLIGKGQDKGKAVRLVAEVFGKRDGAKPVTVGIGDSPNDFPMLETVDVPMLVPHPDGRHEVLSLPGLILAPLPGSRGWNASVEALLDRWDFPGEGA